MESAVYFVVLATDYDGTIAEHGKVSARVLQALEKVKASGRRLILVTGRQLPDLKREFPQLHLFDLAVCENGALLYNPATLEETSLASSPPAALIERLELSGVPLSVGGTIVATTEPHEELVLRAIKDLSLDHHIIFNKGAVMILPPNVNKASGLSHALRQLGVSLHNVVGIGDAENDHAFLVSCGCAVAVENAIGSLKENADIVVSRPASEGFIELADLLVDSDLKSAGVPLPRQRLVIGTNPDGGEIRLAPFETAIVSGGSGSGKSTTVAALLEQMKAFNFQFCVIDPEGDYSEFEGSVQAGDAKSEPRIDQVLSLLEKPDVSTVVNLLAIKPSERPAYFAKFMGELIPFRLRTGRPHWLVVDEAHHCLPREWQAAQLTLPKEMPGVIGITVHPEALAPAFAELATVHVTVGKEGLRNLEEFCRATGRNLPEPSSVGHDVDVDRIGYILTGATLDPVSLRRPKAERKRHLRKYADGALGDDKSFYFRGPHAALNLKAQNLTAFLQLAHGVDDDTWLFHLRNGDYSDWMDVAIKDEELARLVEDVETDATLTAAASREAIQELVERKYTAPAKAE